MVLLLSLPRSLDGILRGGKCGVNLTTRCPNSCPFCFEECNQGTPPIDMPLEECKELMLELYLAGARAITFGGGEPTLHPHLIELLWYAVALGFDTIELITNGYNSDPDLMEALKATGARVGVSLHCHIPEIHDEIAGRKGSFDEAVAFITEALRRGIPMRAGAVICGPNDGMLDDTFEFLRGLGVEHLTSDMVRATGGGKKMAQEGRITGDPLLPHCASCLGTNVVIDADGTVLPCALQRDRPMGNVYQEPLATILKSRQRAVVVSELKILSEQAPDPEPKIQKFGGTVEACGNANVCPSSYANTECCNKRR